MRFRKVSGVGVNLPVENDANLKVEVANYFNKNKLKSYLVDMGCESFFGCEVVLKNSKKAPNKIVLKVVDYKKKGWCNGRIFDGQILVSDGKKNYWTSVSTIDEIVKGGYPAWWQN